MSPATSSAGVEVHLYVQENVPEKWVAPSSIVRYRVPLSRWRAIERRAEKGGDFREHKLSELH